MTANFLFYLQTVCTGNINNINVVLAVSKKVHYVFMCHYFIMMVNACVILTVNLFDFVCQLLS